MQSKLKQKIIFDANVIICLHRFSLWKQVTHACSAAITPIIKREARFYKDEQGCKKPIELSLDVESQKVEEIPVSLKDFSCLDTVLNDFFLQSIDAGEREAIAFLYNTRQSNQYLFCTADMLAIKCLGILGLKFHGISLQELFEKLAIKSNPLGNAIHNHSKELFDRMLNEGFQESHLYKKK
jgi:hypothetical protein